MSKIIPSKPFLMIFYGYPGSGKTYFANNFSNEVQAANLQADRIRVELFEKPIYDKQENIIVNQIMTYMTEEFLSSGVSVIFDANAARKGQRKMLSGIANKYGAKLITIWPQIDEDSSFDRSSRRDKRKNDDKYASSWDVNTFGKIISLMQAPSNNENPLVISGKHHYSTQKNAVFRYLRSIGVISDGTANANIAKPGLVNLVNPNSGRVDFSRRNISIH